MNLLYVVGMAPGGHAFMTFEADEALRASDVIVGYTAYTALLKPLYPEKEFLETGMTKERDRCVLALSQAAAGKTVSVACSGDSSLYGMAGLIYELSPEFPNVTIRVIPGVSAAFSGGARLGAPLGHDVCIISLSDLLTPWELIEQRLRAAAAGNFVICLYNPASHKRPDHLKKACAVLLETLSPDTVCGYVKNIGREGEEDACLTLGELPDAPADMFTTVFIGNSMTRMIGGRMVTPRGYRHV